MSECEWHIADQKRDLELASARREKGWRKTIQPRSYYTLTAKQYDDAVERGKKLVS